MTSLSQELEKVAQQSKAPVLAEVQETGGIGALTPVQPPAELVPVQPKHLTVEDIQAIEAEADAFVEKVKSEPSDWQLGNFVFSLGRDIMEQTQSQVTLYDRKMGAVLSSVASDNNSPVGKNILATGTPTRWPLTRPSWHRSAMRSRRFNPGSRKKFIWAR